MLCHRDLEAFMATFTDIICFVGLGHSGLILVPSCWRRPRMDLSSLSSRWYTAHVDPVEVMQDIFHFSRRIVMEYFKYTRYVRRWHICPCCCHTRVCPDCAVVLVLPLWELTQDESRLSLCYWISVFLCRGEKMSGIRIRVYRCRGKRCWVTGLPSKRFVRLDSGFWPKTLSISEGTWKY